MSIAPPPPPPLVVGGVTVSSTELIATDAESLRVGSWYDTAVTVTTAGVGTAAGAVYVPVAVIVPTVALPPTTPSTCHVTVESAAFATVAVNIWVAWVCMLDVAGETVTLIGAQPSAGAVPGILVAAVGVTTTSARSTRPASSVTASRIVNALVAGTSTTAMAGAVAAKLPEPHGNDH